MTVLKVRIENGHPVLTARRWFKAREYRGYKSGSIWYWVEKGKTQLHSNHVLHWWMEDLLLELDNVKSDTITGRIISDAGEKKILLIPELQEHIECSLAVMKVILGDSLFRMLRK